MRWIDEGNEMRFFSKQREVSYESKEMEKRGIPKVWDCGKIKLEIKFN